MAICSWQTLANVLGVAAVIVLLVGGVLTIISVIPICWGVGAYMIVLGIFVGLAEIPVVFEKIECTKNLSLKMKNAHPAFKVFFYLGGSILLFFCIGISTMVAAALLIAAAFVNGLLWIGPRGKNAQQVPTNAPATKTEHELEQGGITEDKQQLIEDEPEAAEPPTKQETGVPSWAAAPSSSSSKGAKRTPSTSAASKEKYEDDDEDL
eukprot:m.68347 g.68347  ORF g.68347 m.68347 type:complete len:208 (-) comp12765_c0_seq1:28-651(-)